MTRPVQVIVVAYFGHALLQQCLGCLGPGHSVTVVDNSSSPDVARVADKARATYVNTGSNLGFARGVNIGLRSVIDGPPVDVLLLNPDAAISGADVAALNDYLHRPPNRDVAALSPKIYGNECSEERVLWPWPTPAGAWVDALGLGRWRPGSYVIGAVLMLRWEALRQVGLFDERYFLYAEETDWQRRAADMGWRSAMCPDVSASHIGAGMSSDRQLREAMFLAGGETYVRKWFGATGWQSYRAAGIVGAVLRAVVRRGPRRREALARARLLMRGPRRAAGVA